METATNKSAVRDKDQAVETIDMEQFVTFIIGSEIYAVDVLRVHEIIGMTEITHVPNSLPFMKGVINLRGSVVPVVDMRIKMDMDVRDYDLYTVIIIIEVKGRLIGMIVDTVADVAEIATESIQETPHFSVNIERDYIKCIGKTGENLVIILDVDNILTTEELKMMNNS